MKCGLLGRKLGHSYSPMLHALLGDYEDLLYEREPDEVEAFIRRGGLAMELAAFVVQTAGLLLCIWDEWREGKHIRCVLIAAIVLLSVGQAVIELRKYLRARKAPADQTETDPKR